MVLLNLGCAVQMGKILPHGGRPQKLFLWGKRGTCFMRFGRLIGQFHFAWRHSIREHLKVDPIQRRKVEPLRQSECDLFDLVPA